jgi:hypothetical protein
MALARPRPEAPQLPPDFTIPAMARRLLDARGGQKLIDQIANERAVGQRRPGFGLGERGGAAK